MYRTAVLVSSQHRNHIGRIPPAHHRKSPIAHLESPILKPHLPNRSPHPHPSISLSRKIHLHPPPPPNTPRHENHRSNNQPASNNSPHHNPRNLPGIKRRAPLDLEPVRLGREASAVFACGALGAGDGGVEPEGVASVRERGIRGGGRVDWGGWVNGEGRLMDRWTDGFVGLDRLTHCSSTPALSKSRSRRRRCSLGSDRFGARGSSRCLCGRVGGLGGIRLLSVVK